MGYKAKLNAYYKLTKPGIIYGNLLTAVAGFLLACRWHIDIILLIRTVFGIGLVIGSACAFNNYIDRDIDAKMNRTHNRALVQKTISKNSALIYATVLGILGFALLILINYIVLVLGAIGFIDYVIVYGFFKRRYAGGTLVGSVSGALPPVSGYVAVTGHFDVTAAILFLILVCWQMPHFYAISLYRYNDYKAAKIPVLPVTKDAVIVKQRIMLYIFAFNISLILLWAEGGAGYTYLIVSLIFGLAWLYYGFKIYGNKDAQLWGKSMFLRSLIVICGLSGALAFGSILP